VEITYRFSVYMGGVMLLDLSFAKRDYITLHAGSPLLSCLPASCTPIWQCLGHPSFV